MKKYFISYSKKMNRFTVILTIICISIISNYFQLQITNSTKNSNTIDTQLTKYKTISGNRGTIYDANYNEIAASGFKYDFWIDPSAFNSIQYYSLYNKISFLFSKAFNENQNLYIEKMSNKKNKRYVSIKKNTFPKDAESIFSFISNMDGILNWDKKISRFYTYNKLASQTIGYVNYDNIGSNGIEKYFNKYLEEDFIEVKHKKGEKGKYYPIDDIKMEELNGNNIKLTIDMELQRILQTYLEDSYIKTEAKSANAILIEPHTGYIRAMVSIPSIDLNDYNNYPLELHRNTVLLDSYEPGSTFKIVPLSIALELDYYDLEDTLNCENGKYLLSKNITLEDHEPRGDLSIEDITAYSSNIGFSKICNKIDDKTLYKYMKYFGFGSSPYLYNMNTENGFIHSLETWAKLDKHFKSIGQGVSITNLQLSLAYCVIANGGYLIEPKLIEKIYKDDYVIYDSQIDTIRRVLNKQTCNKIIYALEKTVRIGTAKNLALDDFNVAGKTGTAQIWVGDFENGGYSDSSYVATFASIFPSNNPEYVLIVSINEPKYGYHYASKSAVPTSQKIIKEILNNDNDLKQRCINENLIANEK